MQLAYKVMFDQIHFEDIQLNLLRKINFERYFGKKEHII